jgi:4-amino-4-deoxy-L-arabinose transferase-like glycosyltransferase
MLSSGRWTALGSAILGVGALLAISWLIYAIQSKASFWSWPGIVGVAVAGVGFVILVVGFVIPDDEKLESKKQAPPQMRQRGGPHSVNLQAGHDIKLDDQGSAK